MSKRVNPMSFLAKSLALVALLLTPVKPTMLAAGVLILIDLICGVWRAYKVGEKITSQGFRRTITKVVAYQLAIVTAFIIEKYLLDFPIVHPVAALIGITELKSIMENLHIVTGIDFWHALTSKLQGRKDQEKH